MKRFFAISIAVFLIFALCACNRSVNMDVLTDYQKDDFEAEVKILSGKKEYLAHIIQNQEKLFLSVKEPAALEDFTFVFEKDGASIVADGTVIPILAEELLSLSKIYGLFSVSVAGTWKIEKSRPGGVELYICENENTVMYIDAHSHLPLKIISEGIAVDILSFSVAK